MRVLVIGGNRFVGRLLVWRLLARGDEVTLLNRGRLPDPFDQRVRRLTGDRTTGDLERLVGGESFDATVDFAAYTGEDGRRAAEIFAGRTRHHVMVSTGQVYLVRDDCALPARQPAREEYYDGPLKPRPADPADVWDWEYGVGKRACEDALAAAGHRGLPETRVRIPMVNGPLDFHRRIESYLWRLVDGGPLILPDGGEHLVRHVDGSETARFIADILLRPETFGRAYNVAQEETPTLAALVATLRDLLGSRAELVAAPAPRLVEAGLVVRDVSPFSGKWMSFLDPSRARDELGFRHAPLDQTLATIVSSFVAFTPRDRPQGYAAREVERRVVRALRS